MPQQNNVVTYVFEGNTLSLEEAIKRVQKLMRESSKSLMETQNGQLTEQQQALLKSTRQLVKKMKNVYKTGVTEENKKEVMAAGRQALQNVGKLRTASYTSRSKYERAEAAKAQRAKAKADKLAAEAQAEEAKKQAERAFAISPAGQANATAQLMSLERLSKYTKGSVNAAAAKEVSDVVAEYQRLNAIYTKTGTKEKELTDATLRLNGVYKEYNSILQKIASEKGREDKDKGGLLSRIFGKFKSVGLYRLVRQVLTMVQKSISESFKSVAEVFSGFNDTMSQLTSNVRYAMRSIAAAAAPLVQLLTPLIVHLSQIVGELSNKLAELFAAMTGSKTFVKAKFQLEDFLETTKKASQIKGIDEINNLTTENDSENKFEVVGIEESLSSLSKFGEALGNIFELLKAITGPALTTLTGTLDSLGGILGNLFVILEPILWVISEILQGISTGLTTVLKPILKFIETLTSNTALFYSLLASVAALLIVANWSKFVSTLGMMAKGLITVVLRLKEWITQTVIATLKSKAQALANMWEAATWWQKAIAIIAAGGVLAAVVAGIVLTATAATQSTASSTLSKGLGVPAMAAGGVATGATLALIGEGRYNEAVVPLGNSPQFTSMKEGIADRVVQSIRPAGNGSSNQPIILNMDGRTVARGLWPRLIETQSQVGVKLK